MVTIKMTELFVSANPRVNSGISPALGGLLADMQDNGLRTPIKVFRHENGLYEVVSGFRRVAAAKEMGWTHIDAEVVAMWPTMTENMVSYPEAY